MFALLAVICFVLYTANATIADINMLGLGLTFLSVAVLFGPWPFDGNPWRKQSS